MAATAMSALKELLDSETFLQQIQPSDTQLSYGCYYQALPQNLDLSQGELFLLDFISEVWSYTTESVMMEMMCKVAFFSTSFERIDQVINPVLIDLLEDEEQRLVIGGHDTYNLEILSNPRAMLEEQDAKGNPIYMGELELKIEYQRPRKRSKNEFTD